MKGIIMITVIGVIDAFGWMIKRWDECTAAAAAGEDTKVVFSLVIFFCCI